MPLLTAYRARTFTTGGMSVVGTGIAHAQLVSWASGLAECAPKGAAAAVSPSTYYGGEARIKVGAKNILFILLCG